MTKKQKKQSNLNKFPNMGVGRWTLHEVLYVGSSGELRAFINGTGTLRVVVGRPIASTLPCDSWDITGVFEPTPALTAAASVTARDSNFNTEDK
jgi:hypothetical protein